MEQFSVAPTDAPDQPYVHGTDLRIDAVTSAGERQLDDRIRARLWFSDARVPNLRVYNRYLPTTSLQLAGARDACPATCTLTDRATSRLGCACTRRRRPATCTPGGVH